MRTTCVASTPSEWDESSIWPDLFVSSRGLHGPIDRCPASYSTCSSIAAQFAERLLSLSHLNKGLVLAVLPMILCKYFCQFPGQFSRHECHLRLRPRYSQISDS